MELARTGCDVRLKEPLFALVGFMGDLERVDELHSH